jgi:hypothetical protein
MSDVVVVTGLGGAVLAELRAQAPISGAAIPVYGDA